MLVEPAYRLEPSWDFTAGDLVADVFRNLGPSFAMVSRGDPMSGLRVLRRGEQALVGDHLGAARPKFVAQGRTHEVPGLGDQDSFARQIDHVDAP